MAIRRVHALLTGRYGPPGGHAAAYYATARVRSLPAQQAFRTNDLVAIGSDGMPAAPMPAPLSNAVLAHEVAHAWTHPTGAAEAWVGEGWAAYAESEVIGALLGAEEEARFWERMRTMHYRTNPEGRTSIAGDGAVRIMSYRKGPWVFRALRHAIGDSAFRQGMRQYVSLPPGARAGLDEFVVAMSRAASRDVRPILMGWLMETRLPDVEAVVLDGLLVVTHRAAIVELPNLDVDLVTDAGTVRRTLNLRQPADSLDVRGIGAVRAVRVDPDHRYLLRRRWGETMRFTLPAADATGANAVQLWGDFAPGRRVSARRVGDEWLVELPVPEGHYEWGWFVDGKSARTVPGSRPQPVRLQVMPRELLTGPDLM